MGNNTEQGIMISSGLEFIAQSIADSMRAYANVSGGYHRNAYADAIASALYNVYKAIPYNRNDDYMSFINGIMDDVKDAFVDKIELDIDSYN